MIVLAKQKKERQYKCFVYRPLSDHPVMRINLSVAQEIVDRGMAVFFDDGLGKNRRDNRCIRIIPRRSAAPSCKEAKSEQGWVYELASATRGVRVFQGGLCRTETRPAPIKDFCGAKVGHQ